MRVQLVAPRSLIVVDSRLYGARRGSGQQPTEDGNRLHPQHHRTGPGGPGS
jgi:hypothetical protein